MGEKVKISVRTERTFFLPSLPNFIRDDANVALSIKDLTQEQLKEIGQKWTEALMRKGRNGA